MADTTTQVDSDPRAYDVVIAGGGLVGVSLAVALSELPLKIALIEAVEPDNSEASTFDERSIALSRTSKTILSTLGLWPELDDAACPIDSIHVSEKGRFGTAVIDAVEQGIDHLGHVVKSRILGRTLWDALERCGRVDILCPARAESLEQTDNGVLVKLAGDGIANVRAGLLVVADGARSGLREQLGIKASHKSYEQNAIIGNVFVDKAFAGRRAFERFTDAGPLALLPASDGLYTFVLTRAAADVEATMSLSDDDFLKLLQSMFGHRLGIFRAVGRRYSYPLYLSQAEAVVAQNAIVIGNAAHGLHPVAGQGFNLGLRDAAALAELICDAVKPDTDDASTLLRMRLDVIQNGYESWRKNDQKNVVRFTDGLIRLFDSDQSFAGGLRGLGLLGFDMLPAAKQGLARYAMGQGGKLSRLARGLKPEHLAKEHD